MNEPFRGLNEYACGPCQQGQHARCETIVGFTYDPILGESADYCECLECMEASMATADMPEE